MWYFFIETSFFVIAVCFVTYNLFYTIAALFPQRKRQINKDKEQKFVILFPAYKEDSVILDSIQKFLKQDYPVDKYRIAVISDSMKKETNEALSKLPIDLFVVKLGLKSRSLTYALNHIKQNFDKAIVMDADNVVDHNFLSRVNEICHTSQVLQLHRTQKNNSTDVAHWDGISEDINNNIFRKGHVNVGISSALIGSGMVFDFKLLKEEIAQCTTFAEDKELEAILAIKHIFIDYTEDINVYDEKTAKEEVFMRQRTRWAHAQIIAFSIILRNFKWKNLNLYFLDKTFQWIPYPRQIRIFVALFFICFNSFTFFPTAIKWIILLGIKILSIFLAIPRKRYNKHFLLGLIKLPILLGLLVKSLYGSIKRIIANENSFMNTPHSNDNK